MNHLCFLFVSLFFSLAGAFGYNLYHIFANGESFILRRESWHRILFLSNSMREKKSVYEKTQMKRTKMCINQYMYNIKRELVRLSKSPKPFPFPNLFLSFHFQSILPASPLPLLTPPRFPFPLALPCL
jgi:hypothetical protein